MLYIIKVHQFFELVVNLRVHMTVHDVVHMEYHYMFIAKFYPVGNIWIVSIEIKSNISKSP